MSDVKIRFDADTSAAETKLKRLGNASGEVSRTWQQKAEMSIKGLMGKTEGGVGLGGFKAIAGGFGAITLAAIGAGAAYQMFTAASDRAVDAAKTQVEWQQRVTAAIRESSKARSDVDASGAGQIKSLRKSLSMGATVEEIQYWSNSGVDEGSAIEVAGILAASKRKLIAISATQKLIGAGVDPIKAAQESSKTRSGSDREMRNAFLSANGMELTANNIGVASRALSGPSVLPFGAAIVNQQNRVPLAGLEALGNGKALRAVSEQANNTLNPEAAAMAKMLSEAGNVQQSLQAAADAQGTMMTYIKTFGELFGFAGSARNQLVRHATKVNQLNVPVSTRE